MLNRWDQECDLEAMQIAKALYESINEWLEEDVVEFECDFDDEIEELDE